MKLLAIEQEKADIAPERFAPFLKVEAAHVWELYQKGIIREMYFRADRNEAVLMLECGSIEEGERELSNLPLVREGLIRFEIIPLKSYSGFSRLFGYDLDNTMTG